MKNIIQTVTKSFVLTITIFSLIAGSTSFAAETETKQGTWSKHAVSTKGTWEINDNQIILSNLRTGRAPDLKLILSPHPVEALASRNAMEGALVITPIKQSKGTFTFDLPEGLDLAGFNSIGIHCERYTKLFAKSAL